MSCRLYTLSAVVFVAHTRGPMEVARFGWACGGAGFLCRYIANTPACRDSLSFISHTHVLTRVSTSAHFTRKLDGVDFPFGTVKKKENRGKWYRYCNFSGSALTTCFSPKPRRLHAETRSGIPLNPRTAADTLLRPQVTAPDIISVL